MSRTTDCMGQTWEEWIVYQQGYAHAHGLVVTRADVERQLEHLRDVGMFGECSKHPGKWISKRPRAPEATS